MNVIYKYFKLYISNSGARDGWARPVVTSVTDGGATITQKEYRIVTIIEYNDNNFLPCIYTSIILYASNNLLNQNYSTQALAMGRLAIDTPNRNNGMHIFFDIFR